MVRQSMLQGKNGSQGNGQGHLSTCLAVPWGCEPCGARLRASVTPNCDLRRNRALIRG